MVVGSLGTMLVQHDATSHRDLSVVDDVLANRIEPARTKRIQSEHSWMCFSQNRKISKQERVYAGLAAAGETGVLLFRVNPVSWNPGPAVGYCCADFPILSGIVSGVLLVIVAFTLAGVLLDAEGDEMGSIPSNIPINSSDSGPKEANSKKGYRQSVNYYKKSIDLSQVTEREKTLIRANLKAVRKFEKNHPLLPKCSLEKDLASLLVDIIKRVSTLVDAPSEDRNIPVDGTRNLQRVNPRFHLLRHPLRPSAKRFLLDQSKLTKQSPNLLRPQTRPTNHNIQAKATRGGNFLDCMSVLSRKAKSAKFGGELVFLGEDPTRKRGIQKLPRHRSGCLPRTLGRKRAGGGFPRGDSLQENIVGTGATTIGGSDTPNPPGQVIEKLFAEPGSKGSRIVGCDVNAHHFQCGNKDSNARDETVFDFILRHNLKICNRGNEATFQNKDRDDVMDITLTKVDESLILNWKVYSECPDHRKITFEVLVEGIHQKPNRDPRKAYRVRLY
ncbi:uncharacterized protein LOC131804318 [Musca domestica]|uniref:Uncharacterized protein LOC131804318 n=1 Tax=Musca domestica TaxID=7370 RepID=A0ABM3VB48_MUSDO|nr:uncharacterized protein LOC131804318 [Musca domestica]